MVLRFLGEVETEAALASVDVSRGEVVTLKVRRTHQVHIRSAEHGVLGNERVARGLVLVIRSLTAGAREVLDDRTVIDRPPFVEARHDGYHVEREAVRVDLRDHDNAGAKVLDEGVGAGLVSLADDERDDETSQDALGAERPDISVPLRVVRSHALLLLEAE